MTRDIFENIQKICLAHRQASNTANRISSIICTRIIVRHIHRRGLQIGDAISASFPFQFAVECKANSGQTTRCLLILKTTQNIDRTVFSKPTHGVSVIETRYKRGVYRESVLFIFMITRIHELHIVIYFFTAITGTLPAVATQYISVTSKNEETDQNCTCYYKLRKYKKKSGNYSFITYNNVLTLIDIDTGCIVTQTRA